MDKTQKDIQYCSSCPICGHSRIKGKPNSSITYKCPKCKHLLELNFDDRGYRVQIVKRVPKEVDSMKSTI